MAGTATASPFVGRLAELGRLEATYLHARGGEPVTMCVGGEAGVGKSRLVAQFTAQVSALGAQVLLGSCIELGEGSLPYAPVVEAVRGLGRELDPTALDELIGPGRPLLARLLPELGYGEDAGPTAAAAGSRSQARLFEVFLSLLERLADRGTTVLVVEDLHWADRSTLDLLRFLVRSLRAAVLVVLTYRTDELHRRHPLRPFLAELDRSAGVERLEVGRFDRDGTRELLTGLLERVPEEDLVAEVHRRSEGNAFFVEELLAAIEDGGSRTLPPSLENVLLSRVQVLPEAVQGLLRLVAAGSGRVEHRLLAAVSDLPEPELLAALRDAVAHQVLITDPGSESYAFRHALTQEVLYADLLPGERARLHAAFGEALTERPSLIGPHHEATPARLAYHWVRAHDPARALPAAVGAGLQSEAAYGFADAQRHFETALELWDQVADSERHLRLDRTSLLRHAAESAYRAGDPGRAITMTRGALALVDEGTDPLQAGSLHALLGGYLHATGGSGALEQFQNAVRLVPAQPPRRERAAVLAASGEALIGQGRYIECRELCEEAIVIAEAIAARAEEGDARRALGVALAFLGDLDSGVAELREARRIAEEVGKVDDVARGFATLSGLLEVFGRLEEAAAVASEGAAVAARHGLGRWHSPFLTATAGRALAALGRWNDAEELLGRAACDVAPELAAARVYIHSARGQLALSRGDLGAAGVHLAAASDAYTQTIKQAWFATPLYVATADLALLEGRLTDADAAVREGLLVAGDDPIFAVPLQSLGLRAAADRADLSRARRSSEGAAAARLDGEALARELGLRMSPEPGDAVPTPRTQAQAAVAQAELSRLAGRSDAGLWSTAADAWERLSEPHPAAHARWRQAEAQLLDGVGRDKVEPSLQAAYRTAAELGAGPLSSEIEALARRARLDVTAGSAPSPESQKKPASPLAGLGLTAREQDVLVLLATGRTNRQIAESLFISPKTATLHVSNILGKLGVSNRVAAATVAHRLGISPADT